MMNEAASERPKGHLKASPITDRDFAPYGALIEPGAAKPLIINEGRCRRYHDLAEFDFSTGRAGLSLFHSDIRALPCPLKLVERHPLGSQCFIPLGGSEYIIIVAQDHSGAPAELKAFLAGPEQPVNIARNIWHGVLTPIGGPGLFAVIDRIGEGENLEEYHFDETYIISV